MADYPTGVETQATHVWGGDGTNPVDVPVTPAGTDMMKAADKAAQRTLLELGTAAQADTGDFDAAGAAAAVLSTSLQFDQDLADVNDKLAALANLGVDKYTSGPDNAYSITNNDRVVFIGAALTASRTYTLPAIASVNPGHNIIVCDPGGRIGTYSITVDGNGSETINGALTIVLNRQYDAVQFWLTSAGWAATPLQLNRANNLGDIPAPAIARVNLGIDKLTTFADANYTILSTDRYVSTSATLTASRTATLPLANSVPAGHEIVVMDGAGGVTSTNTLVVARSGSDTIDGNASETISAEYGMRRFVSDGTSKWTFDKGVLRAGNNLNDVLNKATARTNLSVATFAYVYSLDTVTNRTFALDKKASIPGTINQIRGVACSSGTCTLAIKINGTDVTGLSAISVTTTPQDITATAANTIADGDVITGVITSASSATRLEFTLKCTRS